MFRFLLSILFKGLLILLPVLFLIIVLKEFLELMIAAATPIADLLPTDTIESIPETNVLAFLLIVGAAFLLGLLAQLPPARALGDFVDSRVLDKIPVYRPLKMLFRALLGDEETDAFKPVFIIGDDGTLEPGYVIEDIPDRPRISVLIPWTPASFAGSMKIVPREKVHFLDLTFDEFSLSLGHFGVGLSELVPRLEDDVEPPTSDK